MPHTQNGYANFLDQIHLASNDLVNFINFIRRIALPYSAFDLTTKFGIGTTFIDLVSINIDFDCPVLMIEFLDSLL